MKFFCKIHKNVHWENAKGGGGEVHAIYSRAEPY